MKGLALIIGKPKDSPDSQDSGDVSAKDEAATALNDAVGSHKFARLLEVYLNAREAESEPDADDEGK